MTHELSSKVMAVHLQRNAYLYVRQSTPRQLVEHAESTRRQYALQQRALQLGWRPEQVIVIDNDLGQSGAFTVDRAGFQKLVAEVSMGRAGIVLGLEVREIERSRARRSPAAQAVQAACATVVVRTSGACEKCRGMN
jgi:DNA invertase Pin-like site-specific DNA recombinase